MCKKNKATYVGANFDAFAYVCPYFTTKPWVNNGYGCTHPQQEERRNDADGNECGACYLGSCPLGYSADDEDLNNPDIDWGDAKPDEGDVENEFIIVRTGEDATDEERTAANKYVRYINRYNKEEPKA